MLRAKSSKELDTIVIRVFQGYTTKEIAEELGRSESWIRNFKSEPDYQERRRRLAELAARLAPLWE